MDWVCRRGNENNKHVKKVLCTTPLLRVSFSVHASACLKNGLYTTWKFDIVWCGGYVRVFQKNMLYHMMQVVCVSKTLITAYQITWYHILEYCSLYVQCCWNLRLNRIMCLSVSDPSELPLCEISLACDNLLCDGHGRPPNPVLIIHVYIPTDVVWIKYAKTEVVEVSSSVLCNCTLF
jgi:hypothetical protein